MRHDKQVKFHGDGSRLMGKHQVLVKPKRTMHSMIDIDTCTTCMLMDREALFDATENFLSLLDNEELR